MIWVVLYFTGLLCSSTYWVYELMNKAPEYDSEDFAKARNNLWWSWPLGVGLWPVTWVVRLCIIFAREERSP